MRVGELPAGSAPARVYAEGWQSWSPMRLYRAGETTPPAHDESFQLTGLRPGRPVSEGVIQAEGVLVVAPDDGPAIGWFSPDPTGEIATIRLRADGGGLVIDADGPVEEVTATGVDEALAAVGYRLHIPHVSGMPAGWSSWSCYFSRVTETDVAENIDVALRQELPVGIVQVDDGYETAIGDWLDVKASFGSLPGAAARVAAAGMRAGIWTAPFLVSPQSALAEAHPDWLVRDADAGSHWGLRMRILDVTHPAAAEQLARVYRTLSGCGYSLLKVDFLYPGSIARQRHPDMNDLAMYREGHRLLP